GLGIPWIAEAGKGLHAAAATYAATERKRIETAAAARTQVAARKLPGKLTSAFAKIAALARERRFGEGVKLLAQVPKSAAQGSNAGAVARMQAKLQRLAGFWEAIQAGPPGAVGMELSAYGQKGKIARFDEPSRRVYVRLASSGRTVPIAINQLTDAQVAAIARRAGPPAEAAGWQLNAALYLLARGNEAEGREALLAAQKAGADVAEALAEEVAATAVAKALDGAEQGKANAVNLLTAALEAHPGSQAVILRHRKLMAELKRLGGISSIVAVKGGPLPDELLRLKLLPKTRISVTPPANVAAAALASPLERGSPVVLGLASWTDYSLSLRWTVEEPADLLVFFRLGEPAAGGFSCGALSVQAGRLELGQLTAGVYRPAAAVQAPDLSQRVSHRARITVQGSTVVVTVDDGSPLRMTLRQLTKGNVGIAVSRGTIFIHDVEVAFPLQAPSPRTTP
ncbi:hypothetical protein HQ560_14075, partial [bacterium]|nr:hypothetical protein [bacterium]